MENVGFKCPVCGKYYFQHFDGLEECEICNWINDIVQYDNHDTHVGSNVLNVSEHSIEFAVLNNINTKETAEELKEAFRIKLASVHENFRKTKWALRTDPHLPSCAEIQQLLVDARVEYMENLQQLLQHC